MNTMTCPKCGEEAWRDYADVGVGYVFGPYACYCGWSENPEYDKTSGESKAQKEETDYILDQWGIGWPKIRQDENGQRD